MVVNSILELVGKTPMLRLNRYMAKHGIQANIIAKLECLNPLGSIKDRVALKMIDDAIAKNEINADTTLIEATSGNTGIGLAMVATVRNLKLIIVMPDSMSKERVTLMSALGAQIILTPGSDGMQGSISHAKQLAKEIPNSYLTKQFANDSVVETHILYTGKEILDDLNGEIDVLVSGVGTGGTLTGISTLLKIHNPDIVTVAVEPEGSPVLSKGTSGKHRIEGIGAGFIPPVLDTSCIDKVITIKDIHATATTKELLRVEGLFVGISSGAAVHAARQVALLPEFRNKNIVVILPDSGSKYLTTNLFN